MIQKWSDLQLKFDLDLDELADDASERGIAPDEARLISEAARSTLHDKQTKPAWMADYLDLLEKGWPWRVATYIAWAGGPKVGRWPATLKELATDVLGLTSPRVVYTWRQKYPTIDAVVALVQSKPLMEHRRELYTALTAVAIQPDYKSHNDRKLALELLGDYVKRSEQQVNLSNSANDLSELSDEELMRWAGLQGEDESGSDQPE